MSSGSIYLAGPIAGHTYEEATGWRDELREQFDDQIEAFSPLRGKAFLSDQETCFPGGREIASPRGIMRRDHFDVKSCDVVLANLLPADEVSIGTCMEIAWAYDRHKPVVLVDREGSVHDHPMINQAYTYKVGGLLQAIILVEHILLEDR